MILFLFYFLVTTLGMIKLNINNEYTKKGQIYHLKEFEYYVIQEIENGIMFFQIESADTYKYLFIELIFETPKDGHVNLSFTITQNRQTSKYENNTILATYADLNGDYLHKSYQNILIPAYSYNQGDRFQINIQKRDEEITYKYKLKISKNNIIPCPNNCTSNTLGFCNFGICACEDDRIDLDCSKTGIPIIMDKQIENMFISGTQYFYFQQKTQLEKIQLDLEISNMFLSEHSQIFVYIMFENYIHGVATQQFNNQSFSFYSNPQSIYQSEIIDVSELNNNPDLLRFDRLLLTIVVPGTCQFNINISLPSEDSEKQTNQILIYVFVPLGVIILIVIIVCIIKKRRGVRPNQIGLDEENKKQGITLQQFNEYLKKIKLKDLDQHYPLSEKNLKSSSSQSCSICLQDYQKDSICLVTPCGHIFHDKCLQTWVVDKQNESCPSCRQVLNEQSLSKYAQEIKNQKLNQQLKKSDFQNKNSNFQIQLQAQMQTNSQMIQY
ncbi:unnamed protein product [Paramecium primaurelia]|uniref:RING-type domain-containing protein n=1 Tax=Paramecium primaurelia TaxID=5886 RepID=A0A8S1JN21_PARPR|nr:unnamed protein product [Paramecium primaurelia]